MPTPQPPEGGAGNSDIFNEIGVTHSPSPPLGGRGVLTFPKSLRFKEAKYLLLRSFCLSWRARYPRLVSLSLSL